MNLIKTKVSLVKNFYLQPSEIEKMPYWEYEYFVKEVNEYIKEENKRNEEEEKKYKGMSSSKMMRDAQKGMPKMPSGSGYPKLPKL